MKKLKEKVLKRGFTIIEVTLVLAITGAIFAMVMSNTAVRVARRRYNDTVQDVVEELRNAYSATINVENYRKKTEDSSFFCSVSSYGLGANGGAANSPTTTNSGTDNYPGRTRCAVYGQVITFGEQINGKITTDLHRYDLIGDAAEDQDIDPDSNDSAMIALKKVGANIVTMKNTTNKATECTASLAGTTSIYRMQWTGQLEKRENRDIFQGAIMIARSPVSGTVHTYFYEGGGKFNVQNWLKKTGTSSCTGFAGAEKNKFVNSVTWKEVGDMDICIGSVDDLYSVGGQRRAVRLHADGSTESSVELLTESDSINICKKG